MTSPFTEPNARKLSYCDRSLQFPTNKQAQVMFAAVEAGRVWLLSSCLSIRCWCWFDSTTWQVQTGSAQYSVRKFVETEIHVAA